MKNSPSILIVLACGKVISTILKELNSFLGPQVVHDLHYLANLLHKLL